MSGWIWLLIVVGILLAIGAWTDWQRRHSGGGNGDTPGDARRSADARSDLHGGGNGAGGVV